MLNIFSDEMRRNPFEAFDQLRSTTPVFHAPPPFDLWLIFDYDGVKRALGDHESFSNAVPAPDNWFIFFDPPRHTKQRALLSKAFTPTVVANLEPRIRELSRTLLNDAIERGEIDLAEEYATPLPMTVIAEMIGIPAADWPRYKRWSDSILTLSRTMRGMRDSEIQSSLDVFRAATAEMSEYVDQMIARRRESPRDDLMTRLVTAEVDGERLSSREILGFFQLLVVGGQETTANLISNAVVCLLDNSHELSRLRGSMELLPSAIEEVLRFRSPLQWVMRTPKRDVELHGQVIPAGALVLPMIGAANRDPKHFTDAARFDVARDPNPHLAFGMGVHFCLGSTLARLEARIALTDLLQRLQGLELASREPWEPRRALNVHGPLHLPIRFERGPRVP